MAKVTFTLDDGTTREITLSLRALESVRASFNPSALESVTLLKTAAAAFLTVLEAVEGGDPYAGDDIHEARMLVRSASMWAVLAATRRL